VHLTGSTLAQLSLKLKENTPEAGVRRRALPEGQPCILTNINTLPKEGKEMIWSIMTFIGVALILSSGSGFVLWFVLRFLKSEETANKKQEPSNKCMIAGCDVFPALTTSEGEPLCLYHWEKLCDLDAEMEMREKIEAEYKPQPWYGGCCK